ncbi:hypothetical protein [Roseomonas sp. AR75]|uniref:hypothetical protein n=1 Tax=Roseomonas sp. AR75 TaxID=2562311 RepID=UPI0010BF9CAD|nr:hypothetical protein [Roseomonas sp. AR75]
MGSGGAFLALWNDLERGHEAEYDIWHTREHVPERVAAPGFRSGRRYVAPDHPVHRWFTLYDVAELGCFETPEYLDLLHNPTPWSAGMRPRFRNFLRVPCKVTGLAGFGLGAALAVLRLPDEAALHALEELVRQPGIVATRFGRRKDASAPSGGLRAGAEGSGVPDDFTAVLLLEALTRDAAARAFSAAAERFLAPHLAAGLAGGVYDLAFAFPSADPAERNAHRRPHWPIR